MNPIRQSLIPRSLSGRIRRALAALPLCGFLLGGVTGCANTAQCSYEIAGSALAKPAWQGEDAYLEHVLLPGFADKHRTARWHLGALDLDVWIEPPPASEAEDREALESAVWAGISQWSGALGNELPRFTRVDRARNQTVRVRWRSLQSNTDFLHAAGGAEYYRDSHDALEWRSRRVILIDPRVVDGENPLPKLEKVAAHELGHVLGLNGHSPVPSDLMYPILNPHQSGVSARDKSTLQALYACDRFSEWKGGLPSKLHLAEWLEQPLARYRLAKPPKALAVAKSSQTGEVAAVGWSVENTSRKAAEQGALESCNMKKSESTGECEVIAVNDEGLDATR